MDVTSDCAPIDFARAVLRGVATMDVPSVDEPDLCLELGLSLWMWQTRTELHAAQPAMLAMRSALVEISGMELATEPIPLFGVDPRLDVINLDSYLIRLMARATARAHCDAALLVEKVLDRLRHGAVRNLAPVSIALA